MVHTVSLFLKLKGKQTQILNSSFTQPFRVISLIELIESFR